MTQWRQLEAQEAEALSRELLRELAEGHLLSDRHARAVARRGQSDDVAFEVEGSGLCIVHLTWAREFDARWPKCEFVQALPASDGELASPSDSRVLRR